jgi:6-phosphogluconolactonase
VANYLGGSAAVFPVLDGGDLGEASCVARHEGSGPNPKRQQQPHPHSANLGPNEDFVYVPDLGTDRVMIYRLDVERAVIEPSDPDSAELAPGSGPRHMTFHPNERFAYVINELGNTITGFAYDAETGALEEIETVPTLPEGFDGENKTADIHITPSGKFLYGSNRGHDTLVIYRIDEETGKLTFVGHEPTQGKTPRNFAIDPTGQYLLAANRESDNIVIFRIDGETGKLEPTGQIVEVPAPVCIVMMER